MNATQPRIWDERIGPEEPGRPNGVELLSVAMTCDNA